MFRPQSLSPAAADLTSCNMLRSHAHMLRQRRRPVPQPVPTIDIPRTDMLQVPARSRARRHGSCAQECDLRRMWGRVPAWAVSSYPSPPPFPARALKPSARKCKSNQLVGRGPLKRDRRPARQKNRFGAETRTNRLARVRSRVPHFPKQQIPARTLRPRRDSDAGQR